MNKKISIIIPIYNGFNYIDKLFESVLNQTYNNYEVIFINDGSSDNSLELLKKYKNKYKFVKVINQKNKGRSESRNIGVENATGDYLTFVDQDDFLSNDFLEKLIKNIKNNDIVLSGYNRVSDNKIIKKNIPQECEWTYYKYCATWGKMYKTSFFKKNNLKFYEFNGEDIFIFLNAISLTEKKIIVSYAGYNNYVNNNSITHIINNKKETRSKIMNLLEAIENSDWQKKLNQKNLLDFYLKTIILHLFTQRKILDYSEFILEYNYYFNWLNSAFRRRKRKINFFNQKGEEKFIIISINIFIFMIKIHLIKPFLFFFKLLGSNLMKN